MRRRITNDIWEQVKTAFASGIGLREIARHMNAVVNIACLGVDPEKVRIKRDA